MTQSWYNYYLLISVLLPDNSLVISSHLFHCYCYYSLLLSHCPSYSYYPIDPIQEPMKKVQHFFHGLLPITWRTICQKAIIVINQVLLCAYVATKLHLKIYWFYSQFSIIPTIHIHKKLFCMVYTYASIANC